MFAFWIIVYFQKAGSSSEQDLYLIKVAVINESYVVNFEEGESESTILPGANCVHVYVYIKIWKADHYKLYSLVSQI